MELYVGNLSYSCTEDDLYTLFSPYGTIAQLRMVTDRMSGLSKGFGFVEMPNSEEAAQAIRHLNEQPYMGRPMRVLESKPKPHTSRMPRHQDSPGPHPGGHAR